MSDSFCINSFDCARKSMGVAIVSVNPHLSCPDLELHDDVRERVDALERQLTRISEVIDAFIRPVLLTVWNLGAVTHAWEAAPPLKRELNHIDRVFGAPDTLLYEFQMSANDKSRMISTMLAYHYAPSVTVRIPAAVKNTVCVARNITREQFVTRCPVTSGKKIKEPKTGKMVPLVALLFAKNDCVDLTCQTFLRHFTDTYRANKTHTSAMLEWCASLFGWDMSQIPADCLDDAADAFIQVLGAIKKRLL